MNRLKKCLTYKAYKPLVYTESLRDAYLGTSICGGKLKGKTVLVTGGTGGIGVAIALRYINEECNVILAGRNAEKLEAVKEYLQIKTKTDRVQCITMDQCSKTSIELVVAQLKETENFIDILVNNAGVYTEVDKQRRFRNVTETEFLNVWKTNYEGTAYLTDLVAKEMQSRKIDGCIVNIASICAEFRSFQYTPYGMSKTAVARMTRKMRELYKPITFVCIEPGSVATSMGDLGIGDNIAKGCNSLLHPALPEEVAAQVAFFSCGFGRYIREEIVASACEIL